jgi:hypothetical protein
LGQRGDTRETRSDRIILDQAATKLANEIRVADAQLSATSTLPWQQPAIPNSMRAPAPVQADSTDGFPAVQNMLSSLADMEIGVLVKGADFLRAGFHNKQEALRILTQVGRSVGVPPGLDPENPPVSAVLRTFANVIPKLGKDPIAGYDKQFQAVQLLRALYREFGQKMSPSDKHALAFQAAEIQSQVGNEKHRHKPQHELRSSWLREEYTHRKNTNLGVALNLATACIPSLSRWALSTAYRMFNEDKTQDKVLKLMCEVMMDIPRASTPALNAKADTVLAAAAAHSKTAKDLQRTMRDRF